MKLEVHVKMQLMIVTHMCTHQVKGVQRILIFAFFFVIIFCYLAVLLSYLCVMLMLKMILKSGDCLKAGPKRELFLN